MSMSCGEMSHDEVSSTFSLEGCLLNTDEMVFRIHSVSFLVSCHAVFRLIRMLLWNIPVMISLPVLFVRFLPHGCDDNISCSLRS